MRTLTLVLCLLASSNHWAQEAPRTQCSETHGFGLRFGDHASAREVRRARSEYQGFSDLFINDGDTSRPIYRVTAVARYATPEQAQAMMHLVIATVLGSEEFSRLFADGDVDDETLDNGIVFFSGDSELNQGVAMQITQEHASLLVTCTDFRRRSEAFTATAP